MGSQILSFRKFFKPLVFFLLFSGICSGSALAGSCKEILGEWDWFIGGTAIFSEDHQARFVPGNSMFPAGLGKWECNPDTGTFKVFWNNGFQDNLTVSADGNRVSGPANTGAMVSGTRKGVEVKEPDANCSTVPYILGQGACGLLTAGDVCQAMNEVYSFPRRITSDQADICRFKGVQLGMPLVEISYSTSLGTDPVQLHNFYRKNRRKSRGFVDLPKLGDDAYALLDLNQQRLNVFVLKGTESFTLQISGRDRLRTWKREKIMASANAMANKALGRLGPRVPNDQFLIGGSSQSLPPELRPPSGSGGSMPSGSGGQPSSANPIGSQGKDGMDDVNNLLDLLP